MDRRHTAPSTARNREPILAVLQRVLPAEARVLEVAAGAGEHAMFFARTMPGWNWAASDPDLDACASIAAWAEAERLPNVAPPRAIDVAEPVWGVEAEAPFDALVCINMIHIAPWEATLGLMAGAERILRSGGVLYTYGAYRRCGVQAAPSNETFDVWLKQRDPRFGVRDLEAVDAAACSRGLTLEEIVDMPANNLSLVFRRN
ncbi:MAG: DUF938 domain-containing protein [Terricaulis sp.]